MEGNFFNLLWDLLQQLPSLITLLVCIGFAATRLKRNPRVALVVLIGLALLFLQGPTFAVIFTWVPGLFLNRNSLTYTPQTIRNVFLVLGFLYNSTVAIGFVVLLAGIFMQRSAATNQT